MGAPVVLAVEQPREAVTAAMMRAAARHGRLRTGGAVALGGGFLLLAMVLGVMIGPTTQGVGTVIRTLWAHVFGHRVADVVADQIVWQIRLPRVLLAAVVGAALTTSGTVLQALVRNPLADPFILGISSGASVGATAVLLFGAFSALGLWALSVGSVAGALVAMLIVFVIAVDGWAADADPPGPVRRGAVGDVLGGQQPADLRGEPPGRASGRVLAHGELRPRVVEPALAPQCVPGRGGGVPVEPRTGAQRALGRG